MMHNLTINSLQCYFPKWKGPKQSLTLKISISTSMLPLGRMHSSLKTSSVECITLNKVWNPPFSCSVSISCLRHFLCFQPARFICFAMICRLSLNTTILPKLSTPVVYPILVGSRAWGLDTKRLETGWSRGWPITNTKTLRTPSGHYHVIIKNVITMRTSQRSLAHRCEVHKLTIDHLITILRDLEFLKNSSWKIYEISI